MQWMHHAVASTVVLAWTAGCGSSTPREVTLPSPGQPPVESTPVSRDVVPPAAVSGCVTDATSGLPLQRALVVLSALERSDRRVDLTDGTGYYEFSELPAGTYNLQASAADYVGRQFGLRQLLQGATPIDLRGGEMLKEINFRLRRGGSISGRILDDEGRPVAFAEVEALRPQFHDGQHVLGTFGMALSDAEGAFHIPSLPRGDYYISAFDPTAEGAVDAAGQRHDIPTFYPGVISAADARRVRLEAAGEVSGVELALRSLTPVRVSGRMVSENDQPLLSAVVIMSPYAGSRQAAARPISVRVTVDRNFEFLNVPLGYYVIRARAQLEPGGGSVFATFQVILENEDVSNIHMALGPGAQLSGRVVSDATRSMPRADLTQVLVSAPAIDGTMFGGEPQGRVEPDGTFRLDSVLAGEQFIRVDSLPEAWALQAVYYRGRDITDTPLDLEKGERVRDIRLVLTDRITRLTGTVRDESREIVTDRTVVTLPSDAMLRRPRGRHVRLAYPDLNGRYQIQSLPAGPYLVAAVEEINESELYEMETLERVAARAVPVLLREGETTTLDLTVGNPGGQRAPWTRG